MTDCDKTLLLLRVFTDMSCVNGWLYEKITADEVKKFFWKAQNCCGK